MNIITTRFGEIDVDESKVIHMRGSIIGFEHLKQFVLQKKDENNPFWWFQSIEDGAIAFVVINPFIAKTDYEPVIDDNDAKLLEIECAEDVVMLAIATIRQNPFCVSINLRAPVAINAKRKIAKQIVLEDPSYPVQYYLTTKGSDNGITSSENCEEGDVK
ncbi:MAG: flagellar assembly protein FliW [Syntrophaceae bacterium]